MCRFIDNFMDIQSNAVTTDESIVLKLAEDVYFLVTNIGNSILNWCLILNIQGSDGKPAECKY